MARPFKLRRALAALSAYAQHAAWALLVAGLAAFLLLPLAAKRCYLDEKALLVGGSVPTIRQSGALESCMRIAEQLSSSRSSGSGGTFAQVAHAAAAAAGLELYQHNFTLASGGSSSGGSSSGGSSSDGGRRSSSSHASEQPRPCSTLHAVVRAPRGDGTEGFLLMLPLNTSSPRAAALAAAVGGAMAGHLQRSRWLAKDAVLLFADAACGAQASAQAWLEAYTSGADLFDFPRAGLLQQALVLELGPGAPPGGGAAGVAGTAELSVHGAGGQLPNLDLYYLIKRNLDIHTSLPASLRASATPLPPALQRGAATLGATAAALGLAPPAAAQRYADELATLAAFSGQLASGEGTGAHAAFLAHQVDAATLSLRLAAASEAASDGGRAALQPGAYAAMAAAEMTLRTFNNLQERLHHSTALYVLVSPDRFASIATYLAPPGCLLAAALAQLAAVARRACGAALPAWRAAWHSAALAHVAGWAAAGLAAALSTRQHSSSDLAAAAGQLLWLAAAGFAAAKGPPALLAALRPEAAAGAAGESGGQRQACTAAVGLAAVVLQGCALLMGQWVRCTAFLLAAVPLYAFSLGLQPSRQAKLAGRALPLPAALLLPLLLGRAGAPWLAAPLLSQLLTVCLSWQDW